MPSARADRSLPLLRRESTGDGTQSPARWVPDPQPQGSAQLDHYLSGLGLESGWLVIFDQRSGQPDISQRTATETATTPDGRVVTVIRA